MQICLFCIGARIIQNTKISPKELIQLDVLPQQNSFCQHLLTVLTFFGLFLWGSGLRVASLHPLLGLSSCISCLCCAHRTQQSGLLQHIWCDFTQLAGFPSLNDLGPYKECRQSQYKSPFPVLLISSCFSAFDHHLTVACFGSCGSPVHCTFGLWTSSRLAHYQSATGIQLPL